MKYRGNEQLKTCIMITFLGWIFISIDALYISGFFTDMKVIPFRIIDTLDIFNFKSLTER